jgi:hypothetical protein
MKPRINSSKTKVLATVALLFSTIASSAQAETDSLDLTLDVTNTEIPCNFPPSDVMFSAYWYFTNVAYASVDGTSSASVDSPIVASWTPGADACGNQINPDGTVQATVTENLDNFSYTLDCSDSACAVTGTENVIDLDLVVPADTETGSYTVSFDVTWVPAD